MTGRFICRHTGAAIAALFLSASSIADGLPKPPTAYFGDYGYCALILSTNRHQQSLIEAGPKQCSLQLSPCSTFKLPNTLIGLQTGVISGPGDLKRWDGKPRNREANNKDHTLQTAITESIPWYFQEIARDVGSQRMSAWLKELNYGNQDISAGIDVFWLGSSLKIDPHGQMELIKQLWHGRLPFKPEYQQQLRDMLVQDSELKGTLHGKTGSCTGAANQSPPDHGWYIGWIDWDTGNPAGIDTTFFVVNITGADARGSEARKITLNMLQGLQADKPSKQQSDNVSRPNDST